MSGSETGVLTSREPYNVGFQKNPVPSPTQPVVQNMRLSYNADGTTVYQPITGSSPPAGGADGSAVLPHNLNMNMSEPMKRKRGRPRKYGPEGSMALTLIPAATTTTDTPPSTAAFSSAPPPPATVSSSFKKARGRPPGSTKKHQMEALGSAGVGFTPHIITVKAGEDVSSKIMSFSQHGARAVCILSANGGISNVTLRQAATSGGTATYEGRFEILSLSGSFLLTKEVGGHRSRSGGLSVSLAGPDGRVLGGSVAGLLTAASPVQVIAGSFIADGRKEAKAVNQMEPPLSVQTKFTMTGEGGGGGGSPPSRGTLSESSGGGGSSPLNQTVPSQGLSMSSMPWK